MRVAALADVHGNAVALEAVLAEVEREQPDLIVSCGDLTWGPLPLETVALLEPWRERLLCVSGNSERELVERKLVDSEIARWEHEQHDRPELAGYLELTQPTVTVEVDRARRDALLPRLAAQRRGVRDRRDACGPCRRVHGRRRRGVHRHGAHAHAVRPRVGEIRLLNPGSVGLPYEPEPGYAYWALLGPDVELRRTPYDLDAAVERLRAGGMPDFERIEELMRTPPPQAEVIEHAERVVFAG